MPQPPPATVASQSASHGRHVHVSVQAAFTGIGNIVSERWISRNHSHADGLRCTFFSSGKGIHRDAAATMTINGSPFGPSAFAMLSDGKMSFSQTCR